MLLGGCSRSRTCTWFCDELRAVYGSYVMPELDVGASRS